MKKSIENYNKISIKNSTKNKEDPSTSTTASSSTSASTSSSSILKQDLPKKNLIFKTKFSSELVTTSLLQTSSSSSSTSRNGSTSTSPSQQQTNSIFKLKPSNNNNNNNNNNNTTSKSFQLKSSLKSSQSVDSFKVFNLKTSDSDESDCEQKIKSSSSSSSQSQEKKSPNEISLINKSTDSEPDKLVKPLTLKTHNLKFDDDDDDDEDLERFKNRIIFKTSATSTINSNQNGANNNNNNKKPLLFKHKSMDTQITNKDTFTKPIKRKIFNTKRETDLKSFKINSVINLDENDVNSNHFDELNSVDLNEIDDEKTSETVSAASSKKTSPNSDLKLRQTKVQSQSQPRSSAQDDLDIQLRNSRKAYECEELGETQAFLDDIFYLMDGLNAKNRLIDRCLCALKLAESCLSSEFRMNLRLSNDYIKRMFTYLIDSPNYQSLALCTSLIMFALNQDKLIIEMDKETYKLLISIINMKQTESSNMLSQQQDVENNDCEIYSKIYERCKDLCKKLIQNKNLLQDNNNDTHNQIFIANDETNQLANEYFILKKKSPNNKKSKQQQQQQQQLQQKQDDLVKFKKEFNDFNPKLLAIECLLTMNLNKKHNDETTDLYMSELRSSSVFDKIIDIIKHTLDVIKQITVNSNCKQVTCVNNIINNDQDSRSHRLDEIFSFFVRKYNRFMNFLQSTLQTNHSQTHSSTVLHSQHSEQPQSKKPKLNSIQNSENNKQTNQSLNQSYLIEYKSQFMVDLIKDSLNYFYDELIYLNRTKSDETLLQLDLKTQLVLSSIRENFLLMINLTHNNGIVSDVLARNDKLIKLIFKCIADLTSHINSDEQFDFLIMSMNILLNIFDNNNNCHLETCKNKSKSVKFDFLNAKSFDIILNLYKDKENLVTLAENDQENQLEHLAEQINTENAENINTAIMNSIHNAGKHMEDHLVAAYSALLIGHMLMCQSEKENTFVKIDSVKSKLKDSSFKYMTQIIRKFVIFMKIMNANGFSADDNLNRIINYLETL